MLDTLEEDSLDRVDELVFDDGASARVRQASLAFMMDHTEGELPTLALTLTPYYYYYSNHTCS